MEQFRSLNIRIDAVMEIRTQAIMDRLDGLLGTKSGSGNRGTQSREASRDSRVNFNNKPSNRERRNGSTRGRNNSSKNTTGSHKHKKSMNMIDPSMLKSIRRFFWGGGGSSWPRRKEDKKNSAAIFAT